LEDWLQQGFRAFAIRLEMNSQLTVALGEGNNCAPLASEGKPDLGRLSGFRAMVGFKMKCCGHITGNFNFVGNGWASQPEG
jgi:hypothetical protein